MSAADAAQSKLLRATVMCLVFMAVEVVGGVLANSLAVLTDAAHLLSDVAGFMVSLFCLHLAQQKATRHLSFGFKRAEVIGALLSTSLIWVVTALLLVEAWERSWLILGNSPAFVPVNGPLMFGIASFGFLANLVILRVLGDHGHGHGGGGVGGGHGHGNKHASQAKHSEHTHAHGETRAHGSSHIDEAHSSDEEGKSDHGHSHGQHRHKDRESSDPDEFHSAVEDEDEETGREGSDSDAGLDLHPASEQDDLLNGLRISQSHSAGEQNLNVTAAYIHALGDLAQSASVMLAAGLIWFFPYKTHPRMQLVDPLSTVLFSIFVVYSTITITKTSLRILMQGVPVGFDVEKVQSRLLQVNGVQSVHEMHFWSLTLDEHFFSCHIVSDRDVLASCRAVLKSMGINHASLQIEKQSDRCASGKDKRCVSYGSIQDA